MTFVEVESHEFLNAHACTNHVVVAIACAFALSREVVEVVRVGARVVVAPILLFFALSGTHESTTATFVSSDKTHVHAVHKLSASHLCVIAWRTYDTTNACSTYDRTSVEAVLQCGLCATCDTAHAVVVLIGSRSGRNLTHVHTAFKH